MQEDKSLETLITQLRGKRRFRAIELLQNQLDMEQPLVPQLLNVMKNEDAFTISAIEILGQLQVKEAVPLIESFLMSEDLSIQEAAVIALGEIKPDNVLEILLSVLKSDHHWDVRTTAAWTLREIDPPQVIPILIETLSDENIHVREAASDALFVLGNASLPSLIEAFASSSEKIRSETHITLSLIVEEFHHHRSPDIKFDRELLIKLIQPLSDSGDVEVRDFASWALQELQG